MSGKHIDFEGDYGGPGGNPQDDYGMHHLTKELGRNPTRQEAIDWYMENVMSIANRTMPNATAMEKATVASHIINAMYDPVTGDQKYDPRAWAVQEYYRENDPTKLHYEKAYGPDIHVYGNRRDKEAVAKAYAETVGKLPAKEREDWLNKGRDFYYMHIDNPNGDMNIPADDYWNVWRGMTNNMRTYDDYDKNDPNIKPIPTAKWQKGGTTGESPEPSQVFIGDFLYSQDDIDFLNSNKEYCPNKGDCLGAAFMGYDKIVASKHGDFPSSDNLKKKLGFESLKTKDYWYDKENDILYKDGEEVSPRTKQWIESQPFFKYEDKKGNLDFSVDSWDVHGQIVSKGGVNLFTDTTDGRTQGYEGGAFGKLSDEERKEIFRKMPVGSIIGFGADNYGKGLNEEHGLANSNHSAVVVGFMEDGTPVIYDWRNYTTLDKNYFDYAVTNITYPKEFEGKTKAGLELLDKFEDTPTELNLDISKFNELGYEWSPMWGVESNNADMNEMNTFLGTLKDYKVDLMNDLNIGNSEYDMLAKLLLATAMQETQGGATFEHNYLGTTFGTTHGMTQMNINNIIDSKNEPQLSKIAEKYGITKADDLMDNKKAAIASMIYAKRNLSAGRANYEKGIFKEGETGIRTYNPRDSFSDRMRSRAMNTNPVYDGYSYNTEEGPVIDFFTGNNYSGIGWDKSIETIQESFDTNEKIKPGRYKVYTDKDGNKIVDKVTYGNNPDLSDEMKFIYNWQSPTSLRTGDAQGGSKYAQSVKAFYDMIGTKKYGGMHQYQEGVNETQGMLNDIYGRYPAMKNMGPVTLHPDTAFTKDFTGIGDIEYFAPTTGAGVTTFPNENTYTHPDPTKQSHGIVYNPATNNTQDVFLDMLHGMVADPNYKKLRDDFAEEFLKFEEHGVELAWREHQLKHPINDGRAAFVENFIDGYIRSLMFEGTPEDYERKNYYAGDKELYMSVPSINQAFTKLQNYLMTNEVPSGFHQTLKEVEITPKGDVNDLGIPGKYKQGGTTYNMTKDIIDTKNLLSLLI
jgi:hypothetical protein